MLLPIVPPSTCTLRGIQPSTPALAAQTPRAQLSSSVSSGAAQSLQPMPTTKDNTAATSTSSLLDPMVTSTRPLTTPMDMPVLPTTERPPLMPQVPVTLAPVLSSGPRSLRTSPSTPASALQSAMHRLPRVRLVSSSTPSLSIATASLSDSTAAPFLPSGRPAMQPIQVLPLDQMCTLSITAMVSRVSMLSAVLQMDLCSSKAELCRAEM